MLEGRGWGSGMGGACLKTATGKTTHTHTFTLTIWLFLKPCLSLSFFPPPPCPCGFSRANVLSWQRSRAGEEGCFHISPSWVKSRSCLPGTAAASLLIPSHQAITKLLPAPCRPFPEPVTAFFEPRSKAQGVRENWQWQFSPHCQIVSSVL